MIEYQCDIPVGYGHVPQTEIEIFTNMQSRAPIHVDSKTKLVAVLSLDLNKIPEEVKQAAGKTRMGEHRYYSIEGVIKATYESAMVTYAVQLGGKTHLPRLRPWWNRLLTIKKA